MSASAGSDRRRGSGAGSDRRRGSGAAAVPPALPATLRWAVWLLAVEAVGVGLLAGYLLYRDISGGATNLRGALGVTAYAVLMAAALAGLAVALSRRKARGRAPAIVLQLLAIALASFMIQGGPVWLGVLVTVLGLLVAGLLLAPATTAALS